MNALKKRRKKPPSEVLKVYGCGCHDLPDHRIEAAGYDLVLVYSEAISSWHGLPKMGLMGLNEVGRCLEQLSGMTCLPMIACAEVHSEGNAREMTRVLEDSGMAGMYINDRWMHHLGPSDALLSTQRVVAHINAVKQAQQDPDFLLVAGSGMDWRLSIDALIERLCAYSEAGADVISLEGWKTLAEIEYATDRIPGYKLLTLSGGSGMLFSEARKAHESAFHNL